MTKVELVAIVNSFNRLTLIKKALPALASAFKECPFGSAIVVFDAGSTDGTLDWLKDFARECGSTALDVIRPDPEEQSSFSYGVNAACSFAAAKYPDLNYYLLYETDNWVDGSRAILLARKLLSLTAQLAGAGFTVQRYSGPAGFGCSYPTAFEFIVGQQITYWLKLDRPKLEGGGTIDGVSWALCDVVYTSPLLVKRKAWEESGGMNAGEFPFSDCDIDWSWRLHHKSWKMAVLFVGGVVHDNEGELSGWSVRRVLDYHRARLRLLCRHIGQSVSLIKPILFIRHCLELLVLYLLPREKEQKAEALEKRRLLIKTVMKDYLIGAGAENRGSGPDPKSN